MGALLVSEKFPRLQALREYAEVLVKCWEEDKYNYSDCYNIDQIELEYYNDEMFTDQLSDWEVNYVLYCIGY